MKYRIAVIEDNNADVFLLEDALEKNELHCELDRLEDGGTARSYLLQSTLVKLDLILLDLNLPKVDGAELLRLIRQQAHLKDVPVLVWSSAHPPRDKESIEDFNGVRFVLKPSSLDGFRAVGGLIRDLLREKASGTAMAS